MRESGAFRIQTQRFFHCSFKKKSKKSSQIFTDLQKKPVDIPIET